MSNNVRIEKQRLKFIGQILESKNYGKFKIIEYNHYEDVTIEFIDTGYISYNLILSNILKGEVKDLLVKNIIGVGYLGGTKYDTRYKIGNFKPYETWKGMLTRCYSEEQKKLQPAYKDSTCCESWHNFQVFAKWCSDNMPPDDSYSYQLDKDILHKGNKVYSPDFCCLVPPRINKMLEKSDAARGDLPLGVRVRPSGRVGDYIVKSGKQCHLGMFDTIEEAFAVYRKEKLTIITEAVDEYKSGLLPHVQVALLNYDVSIND